VNTFIHQSINVHLQRRLITRFANKLAVDLTFEEIAYMKYRILLTMMTAKSRRRRRRRGRKRKRKKM